MRLVHLTDPHLSTLADQRFFKLKGKRKSGYLSWRKNRSKKYLPTVLEHLVDAVREESADVILLTGDLIQIGLDAEIDQVSAWLKQLSTAGKVLLVPGNHDVYAKGSQNAIEKAWKDYLFAGVTDESSSHSTEYPVVHKRGGINFVGLSSACVTPVFMATGEVGADQIMRLEALLRQSADEGQLVCLSIHHPPLPGMTKWRKALHDADALQNVLQQYPPALIFHGHLHHNRELLWGDSRIYCTSAASSCSDASYRVVDIQQLDQHWKLQMTLKTITVEPAGQPEFLPVDEQRWEVPG